MAKKTKGLFDNMHTSIQPFVKLKKRMSIYCLGPVCGLANSRSDTGLTPANHHLETHPAEDGTLGGKTDDLLAFAIEK